MTAAMSFHWSSAVLNSFDWLANQIRPVWVIGWHKIFMTSRSHAELDFDLRSRIISLKWSHWLSVELTRDSSYRTCPISLCHSKKNVEKIIFRQNIWLDIFTETSLITGQGQPRYFLPRSTSWLVSKFLKINFFMHPLKFEKMSKNRLSIVSNRNHVTSLESRDLKG